MPVNITDIKFQDSYTGVLAGGSDSGANFLMGCVGDFAYATIKFNVAWSVLGANINFDSVKKTITLIPCGLLTSGFVDSGFQVGDTIVITGSASNNATFAIISLTNTVITVDESVVTESATGVNVYGATTINAFDFYYNNLSSQNLSIGNPYTHTTIVINNPSKRDIFSSQTDSLSVQKYSGIAQVYYGGSSFMSPNTPSRAWFTDFVDGQDCRPQLTYEGTTTDYKQQYQIVFPFLITPLFLSNQLQLIQNAYAQSKSSGVNTVDYVQPDYFTNNNSLQFIYQIDAKYTPNQNIINHTSSISVTNNISNISWFNSFFPSGVYDVAGNLLTQNQYKFNSIAYTDNSGNPLTEIDFNQTTNVVLTIALSSGSLASFDTSKFILNFMYLPNNPAEYSGYSAAKQGTFRQVFLHDRATQIITGASTNGDKFGTSTQAITNLTSALVGGRLVLTFQINLGSLSKSTFSGAAEQDRNYLIWVTPQNHNCTKMTNANRSAIIGDVNLAKTNTDDATLLSVVTNSQSDVYFYRCDTCSQISDLSAKTPETSFNGYVGDYGISYLQFKVKKNYEILSINTSFEVQVANAVTTVIQGTFPIEQWNNDTTGYWDGNVNQIQINQTRGFPLASNDLRNIRSINRHPSLDDATYYYYDMVYGFQLGYQYWQNITDYYKVFDRYHTNYWSVYSQGYAGLTSDPNFVRIVPTTQTTKIKFKIVWEVVDTATNITTEFIRYCDVFCYDENGNAATFTMSVDTTDQWGNSLFGVIAEDQPTTVECQISAASLATPGGYTAVGELVAYYTIGSKEIYDRVASDDSGVIQGSIWTAVPLLQIDTTNNVGSIVGYADASKLTFPIKNLRIYSKLQFVK